MNGLTLTLALLVVSTFGPAVGTAELRDLGTFGDTCPIERARTPEPPHVRLSLPEQPPEDLRVTTRLPFAPGPRTRHLIRSQVPWPAGAPTTLAFVGTDPDSRALVRTLPPRSAIYLLTVTGWDDVRRVQALCPTCLVQPGGDPTAALFGVTRYPALLQWTGQALVVTEGAP